MDSINTRKKVQIYGYTRNNVGDDLFIYFFLKAFPNVDFYININNEQYAIPFLDITNVNISNKNNVLDVEKLNNIDACVYIAGSIFMEKGNALEHQKELLAFITQCKQHNIPYYFISSNYGPFVTEEYFNISKCVFENCKDICFRDKYSYDLFSQIKSVRYAPDYLFSIDFSKYAKECVKNTIGISVIDMDIRPHLKQYEHTYLELLANNIKQYIEIGLEVSLISFCEHEGDKKGIAKILENLPNEYCQKVKVLEYTGNISMFLEQYSKFEYVLCTRFHSMVLSTVLGQKSYCLSYSDKLDNVIDDLTIYSDFSRIEKIIPSEKISLDRFSTICKSEIEEIKILAKEQIKEFERYLTDYDLYKQN